MRHRFILAIAGLPLVASIQPAQAQVAGEKIANSYICVFKKGDVSRENAQAEADSAVKGGGGRLKRVYTDALQGFVVDAPPQDVEKVKKANPKIAYCEQDQVVTLGLIQASGTVSATAIQPAQVKPWGISRVRGGVTGTFATAWVIDTGIDLTHPDLNVDTARSRSFVSGLLSANDQNGHGTHVAGTIAARNNTIGVIGVAAGARVVAVRVLDGAGSGSNSGVIAGVDYVAANGRAGDVANMSLGGGISSALDSAVVSASSRGIRFALAAGNESDNANNHSPARANGPYIYTVSAFASGDKWASFSNYGNPPIDVAEPGVSIRSTWLAGGYNTISGTSMAAPHLAGILLTGGVYAGGTVIGDPDGRPDTIGVR